MQTSKGNKVKKKILVSTNHHGALTGFGKNCKNILSHLYKTDKYEIIEFANGVIDGNEQAKLAPWKVVGSIPNDKNVLSRISQDSNLARMANYGYFYIDKVIKDIKPDVFIGIEDIWAFNGYWDRKWWNKINCMIWTTLDSLPILPEAVKMAENCQHFYVWASFAEEALHQLGKTNAKTLHGSLITENFKKLEPNNINDLKKTFNVKDDFIIGFVFRNQLRKSVPNLLDGYKLFLERNPESRAKLLLHTNWKEGWDIVRACSERKIDLKNILTTYVCSKCHNYLIHPFLGHDKDCPFCKSEKTLNTVSISQGVSEGQLNEIYNIMDVYCHPFTSGGQEIPIQEAKLCELITLVTDYSCGTDMCSEESAGIPLSWSKYEEPATQFIKASTNEQSICESLEKVWNMSEEERSLWGKKARQYVINNYSGDVIGEKLENIIDNMPEVNFDFNEIEEKRNKKYKPNFKASPEEFIKDLYKNIIRTEPKEEELNEWVEKIKDGESKEKIFRHFSSVIEQTSIKLDDALDKNDKGRVGIYIDGDPFITLAYSYFFKSIKEMYPDWEIYCFCDPKNHSILDGIDCVKRLLPSNDALKDSLAMEGSGDEEGYFDVFYYLPSSELIASKYSHNCKDKSCI